MKIKLMSVKEVIFAIIIAILLAGLDLLILPARLFVNINVADVDPIYFSLMVNQWFLIIVGLIAVTYLCPNLELGLKKAGFKSGLKKFLPSILFFLILATFAYYYGLRGYYDYKPSGLKVIIETFIYNLSAGFIQELYIRGLLINALIWILAKKKNAPFIAIIISSILFSFGHIPAMIGLDAFTIAMRLIWTLMLGIYLGIMYIRTGNLWIPIIAHVLINFSGIAFNFTTYTDFPLISVIIIMLTSVFIGVWSIYSYFKNNETATLQTE